MGAIAVNSSGIKEPQMGLSNLRDISRPIEEYRGYAECG